MHFQLIRLSVKTSKHAVFAESFEGNLYLNPPCMTDKLDRYVNLTLVCYNIAFCWYLYQYIAVYVVRNMDVGENFGHT